MKKLVQRYYNSIKKRAYTRRVLFQGVLINGMCPFEDALETAVREFIERTNWRTLNRRLLIHAICIFRAHLLTVCAYSKRGGARRRPHRASSLTESTSEPTSVVFLSANEWHNKWTIPIYASAEFPSCERCLLKKRNGIYLSNRGKPEGKGWCCIK